MSHNSNSVWKKSNPNNIQLTRENVTTFIQRANGYLNLMYKGLWKYVEAKENNNIPTQKKLIYTIHEASNNLKDELLNIDNMIPMFLFPTEPRITNYYKRVVNGNGTRNQKISNRIIPFANYPPRNVPKQMKLPNFFTRKRRREPNNIGI